MSAGLEKPSLLGAAAITSLLCRIWLKKPKLNPRLPLHIHPSVDFCPQEVVSPGVCPLQMGHPHPQGCIQHLRGLVRELQPYQSCSRCYTALVGEPGCEDGLGPCQHSQGSSQLLTCTQVVAQPELFNCPTHWLLAVPKTPPGKSSDAFCFVARAEMCLWRRRYGNTEPLRVSAPQLMCAAPGPAGFLNNQVAWPHAWHHPNLLMPHKGARHSHTLLEAPGSAGQSIGGVIKLAKKKEQKPWIRFGSKAAQHISLHHSVHMTVGKPLFLGMGAVFLPGMRFSV